MILLIPPSEGKVSGGKFPPITLSVEQQHMYNALCSYNGNLAKLLGVQGKALEHAKLVNAHILQAPTLPAIQRYSGVVYQALSYETLTSEAKAYVDNHIKIVSGLFGLLNATDRIPEYKLKIEKLGADAFYKPIIGKALKDDFVIDLLAQAQRKAVYYKNGVRVEFIIRKNGEKKPAGHAGKTIKGKFIRWLCENQVTDIDRLIEFREDGFMGRRVNNSLVEFELNV